MAIVRTDDKHYKNIANALKTHGEIAEDLRPNMMAEAIYEVATLHDTKGYNRGFGVGYMEGETVGYRQGETDGFVKGEEAGFKLGKQAQYDEFWDTAQQKGNRTNYERAFAGMFWTNELFKPKWDIKPKWGGATSLFQGSPFEGNLREHLESLNVTLDVSGLNGITQMFYGAEKITEIPFLDLSGCTNACSNLFYGCKALITAHIKLSENVPINNNCFTNCTALENLTVEGTIGVNGFDVHWSTKLNDESILSILRACNKASVGVTITLPTTSESKIANNTELNTAAEIARANGYTIAYNQ